MKLRSRRLMAPAAMLRRLYRPTYAKLVLVLFLFLQRYFVQGIAATGLK